MSTVISKSRKGGRRAQLTGRFDLLPVYGVTAAAEAFAEGEDKYGRFDKDPTSPNWHYLDVGSEQSPISHAISHLQHFVAGENWRNQSTGEWYVKGRNGKNWKKGYVYEDHLGHALANIMMMCQYERDPLSPWYKLTYPEMLAKAYRESKRRKRKSARKARG